MVVWWLRLTLKKKASSPIGLGDFSSIYSFFSPSLITFIQTTRRTQTKKNIQKKKIINKKGLQETMSVAVCSSPVFSPSSSLFCNNKALNISPAHQNLTLSHSHLTPLASSPSAASPTSPFCLRLLKPPVNSVFGSDSGPGDCDRHLSLGSVLKRKRPTRLDILVAPVGVTAPISLNAETLREESGEVEREGDEFSVYCKRGKREAMEDRFSAITNIERDPKQVT